MVLNFKDEFEHEASDGITYYIRVEGRQLLDEEDNPYIVIDSFIAEDEMGDVVDDDNKDLYLELKEEAEQHNYSFEEHEGDFDAYGSLVG